MNPKEKPFDLFFIDSKSFFPLFGIKDCFSALLSE